MSAPPSSDRPLDGVRVVDVTTSYAGPTASMYLADLGATVIKVEKPGGGDDARGWGPPFVDGTSAWFATANRNKSSVVLDLRNPAGREALLRLIASADVFLQNMNPTKLERLGIDGASLLDQHPRLVYCAMSGFGLDGPDSHLPGYDLVAQARSGLMSVTGESGRSPQRVSTALSDVVTGMCAAIAINAALVRQARHGRGEIIDVSLLDTDLAMMAPRIGAFQAGEPEPAPSGGTDSVLAVYQPFQTADRVIVIAIGNDMMWQRFCGATGLADLGAEPKLRDNAGRREQRPRITARIAEVLATRTAEEWLGVMESVSVPAAMVQSLSEVISDPQVVARRSLMDVPGTDGSLVTVRSPFRLASSPHPRNERFPDLGADTERVLTELGYTTDEARDLAPSSAGTKVAPPREEAS
ncbi:CaiB/BaiF CoA-transferase family protein [Aeromicrobium sp. Leaf350]|uniref:CaiB/BaiF CoA transferase family protein n=1 Tax=Aeromicrobium sp. Leaf350 TaxID=2876565 RepID=UPI002104B12D|nr:CoA transferase [Aeromicrobium sp. Leaf350]